ncbi:hypothetical protein ACWEOE_27500 [Amycolatopsis sp. NPDC004368]
MDEYGIEDHPDLMDPDWQRHAEKEAWVGLRRNRRRANRRKWVVTSAVVVVAGAGAVLAFSAWGNATAEHASDADTALPASTSVATTKAAPTELPDLAHVDLTRPFDNTPAQNWAEGIAGVTVPPAAKVGSFSAQQVKAAEDQVKQAITAAQLDQDTLTAHNPAEYVGLLAPDERQDVQADAPGYLIYLADGYHLLPVPPRMNGSMTVKPGKAGELVLHTSYVVAYAFDPGTHATYGPADLEPFVRVDVDYVMRSGSGFRSSSRGLWVENSRQYFTSVACGSDDRLAPAFSEHNYAATSLAPEPGRFDPAKPMPTEDNCHH